MAASRAVKFEILGDASSFQKAFGLAEKSADGLHAAAGKVGGAITGMAKIAGAAMLGIGAAAGVMAVAGIRAASDLNENLNKVNVVFGDSAGEIRDWASTAAQSFGISRSAALGTAGTFGNLFVSMGIGQDAAVDMSKGIVGLAADLGSFNNMGTEEVLEKIRAGLVGETEPLRALGVNLNAAAIEAKAMEMGLVGAGGELSAAAKAQAAYALILEQTTTAQGDFANTKTGMANSLKIIKASFSDVQAEIGNRLLPIVAPLIASFAAKLPAAIDIAGRVMDRLMRVLSGPLRAAFILIRDGVLTFAQALQGNWSDSEKIVGFHRVIGNIALIIRERVIPAVQAFAAFFEDRLWPIIQSVGETFTRVFSAIASGNWGEALSALFDGFVERLGMIGGLLADLGQAFLTWVEPLIPPLLEKLGQLALSIGDWIVNEGLPMLVEKLGQWADAFGAWAEVAVPPMLAKLGVLLEQLGAWVADVGLPLLFDKLGQWGQALIDWIGPRIVPVLEALGTLLLAIGDWMINVALPGIGGKLAEWGNQFWQWVKPQIVPMLAELGDLLAQLGAWLIDTALPAIGAKLAEWGAAFVAWVGPQIVPLLGELGNLLAQLGAWLIDTALPTIAQKLAEWGASFVAWVAPQIPPLLLEIGKLLLALTDWMTTTALPAIIEKLATWAAAFLTWIATDVLPQLPDKLWEMAQAIGNWAVEAAPVVAAYAASLGSAFVEGMIAAVKALAQRVADAAWEVVKGAVDWVKGKAGISSPSKLTHKEIGEPLAAGIATGVLAGAGAVRDAAIGVVLGATQGAAGAAQVAGAGIGDAVVGGFVTRVTSRAPSAELGERAIVTFVERSASASMLIQRVAAAGMNVADAIVGGFITRVMSRTPDAEMATVGMVRIAGTAAQAEAGAAGLAAGQAFADMYRQGVAGASPELGAGWQERGGAPGMGLTGTPTYPTSGGGMGGTTLSGAGSSGGTIGTIGPMGGPGKQGIDYDAMARAVERGTAAALNTAMPSLLVSV